MTAMSNYPNKVLHYISLVLFIICITAIPDAVDTDELGAVFLCIVVLLVAALKTAPEDSYIALVGKNIIKKFKSHKNRLKENLDD